MHACAASLRRAAAAAIVLAAVAGAASAKDESVNPLPLYLQGLDVAPGVEHRFVVLHVVLAQPRPVRRAAELAFGGLSTPELLAFGKMEKSAAARVDAVSFTAGPTALLTGDVLRTETADFAVLRDVVLPGGVATSAPLVRLSHEVTPDRDAAESTMLGPILPSAIRFLLFDDRPAVEIRDDCRRWAEDVHVAGPRQSPADLRTADLLKKRVADYRKSFADLLSRTPTGGREIVGCAVLLDGALASFETFADGKSFAAAWPKLLDGIAAEAAVLEARGNSLEADIPDPADPDRFLSEMKQRLLGVYGARHVQREVRESGRNIDLALDAARARALIVGEDRVVHFVLVTDPARRGDRRSTDDSDLNAAARKLRPTEEEKRRLERRGSGEPKAPDPPPPAPK